MDYSCLLKATKGDKEGDNSITSRQYICCILNVTSGGSSSGDSIDAQKKIRRKYSPQALSTVKRLSIAQVLLGSLIVLCQLAPSYWHISLVAEKDVHVELGDDVMFDIALPGVWAGVFIFVTGIVGIVGAKKNVRCLIIAHLVLNSLATIFAMAVAVLASINIGNLISCKIGGAWTGAGPDYQPQYDYYDNRRHVTTNPTIYNLLGESFKSGKHGRFYCVHPLFTAWMVLESVMVVSGLAVFGLTIHLLVKNSKALCGCCRACCTLEDDKDEADVSLITA